MVAQQSKPVFNPLKRNTLGCPGITHKRLKEKIHIINSKVHSGKSTKFRRYESNSEEQRYADEDCTGSDRSASDSSLQEIKLSDSPIKPQQPISNPNGIIIYDHQRNEAEKYSFDENYRVTDYKKVDDDITAAFNDSPFHRVYCCCWFERERFLNVSFPQETAKGLRKPHNCRPGHCLCCCKINETVSSPQLIKDLEKPSPSTWFKNLTNNVPLSCFLTDTDQAQKKSPASDNLLVKCLTVPPIAPKTRSNQPKENAIFTNPTNLQFPGEYYQIGLNGDIELLCKNVNEKEKHLNLKNFSLFRFMLITNKYNICCWYKREQYAYSLLQEGVPSSSVNFIRNPHRCLINYCACCCKPENTVKSKLQLLPLTARHSNDVLYNKSLPNGRVSTITKTNFESFQFDHSFYIPLESFIAALRLPTADNASEIKQLKEPKKVIEILTKFSQIKFTIKGTLAKHTVVADVDLKTMSMSELSILKTTLDLIKSMIVNKRRYFTEKFENSKKIIDISPTLNEQEPVASKTSETSSSLTELLSNVAATTNKQYIASFREYASINFPELEISQGSYSSNRKSSA